MQAQQRYAVSEETTLAFKRHILKKSSGFASEPAVDLFRVNLLAQMLDRYDALRAKGMGDAASQSRVLDEYDDIAAQMRAQGFEEAEAPEEAAPGVEELPEADGPEAVPPLRKALSNSSRT